MNPGATDDRAKMRPTVIRFAATAYAIFAFFTTFAFFTCFVIFLGNLPSPSNPWITPTVDTGDAAAPILAAIINIALIALFGLQHSLMARPFFKAWLTKVIPEGLERSTYVIAAVAAGFIMILFWQPIPIPIWDVPEELAPIFWTVFASGWIILLVSAINFGLLELLGVRQSRAWAHGGNPVRLTLKLGGLYSIMPHPMYVGVLLGLWVTPSMTFGHLLMAAGLTIYILIAKTYEERDLTDRFGDAYQCSWRNRNAEHYTGKTGADVIR